MIQSQDPYGSPSAAALSISHYSLLAPNCTVASQDFLNTLVNGIVTINTKPNTKPKAKTSHTHNRSMCVTLGTLGFHIKARF